MKKALILLAIIALAVGGLAGWNWLYDNKFPNFRSKVELYVRPGDSAQKVLSELLKGSAVRNHKSLERTFAVKKVSEFITPGHYVIGANSSSVYVARMLNNGWQTPVRLTLSGNLRLKGNIAAKIASQMLLDSATVHKALDEKSDVFSKLVPDTYEIYWTATMDEIFQRCEDALNAFWTEENDAKAAALGMTRSQVSTLASIVKAESNYEPELPKIAGVYLNRLSCGMPLQADPTVAFCFDYQLNRVLSKHLQVESPYNTYKYSGLPPGPICVPTRECLQAVLDANFGTASKKPGADGNLYFCANSDFSGTHVFAKTLTAHNANARAFQKELDRRAKLKKAKK